VLRFGVGSALLLITAALFAIAGGIDVLSPTDWQAFAAKWEMPPPTSNERRIMLLLAMMSGLLAVVRLTSSSRPVARP
jgi:hypothetical protein